MVSIRCISVLASSSAAALLVMLPAIAESESTQISTMAEATEAVASPVESNASEETAGTIGATTPETTATSVEGAEGDAISESGALTGAAVEPAFVVDQPQSVVTVDAAAATVDETVSTSAETFFVDAEATETATSTADDTTDTATAGTDVAQVTRPLYRGVSPFYVGVGGNIGIVESDESAVGDFGFNIISKISLGPRFAVRPTGSFSEDDVSVAIPVTYNFNPIAFGDFNLYPSAGVGVDIGDEIGLLVNGGVDIPISRRFTANSQVNWRVTDDFGFGLSLGVAYNFPFFFE